MVLNWFGLLCFLSMANGLNLDHHFCSLFRSQSIYKQLDLGGDGCSMNIFNKDATEICLTDPDDSDVFLEGTCKSKTAVYER